MELERIRNKTTIVGCLDIFGCFIIIIITLSWVAYSCPSRPHSETERRYTGTQKGSSRQTNFTACHDARNVTQLGFRRNTTKVIIGSFFRLVIPHKEFASGSEMQIYCMADVFLSVPQILAASFAIKASRELELTKKEKVVYSLIYIFTNLAIGGGYAFWRRVEGAWFGLIVGASLRLGMTLTVIAFFCKVVFDKKQTAPKNENEVQTEAAKLSKNARGVHISPYIVDTGYI